MPTIHANYKDVEVVGYNASDRCKYNASFVPSKDIQQYAPKLYEFMRNLKNEGDRSAFACAETQALARVLVATKGILEYSKIEFGVPKSDEGVVLWYPCRNCSEWLELASGSTVDRKYRLNPAAIKLVPSTATPPITYKFDASDFPLLGSK